MLVDHLLQRDEERVTRRDRDDVGCRPPGPGELARRHVSRVTHRRTGRASTTGYALWGPVSNCLRITAADAPAGIVTTSRVITSATLVIRSTSGS